MPDYLQKIIYLTEAQYETLQGGGTVGSQTGINNNYLYFTTDDNTTNYVPYRGNITSIGGSSPASGAKAWWKNVNNVPRLSIIAAYNNSGTEYSMIYSKGNADARYGTILRWGYADTYMRILRQNNADGDTWYSEDWEKISAGKADTLTTGRTLKVALGSTSASTAFNGSADITNIGVGGTLGVGNGGTGATSFTANSVIVSGSTTTSALTTRGIYTLSAAGSSGWNTETNRTKIPDMNFIAYWNGTYNGTNSNLTKLGTITSGTWNGTAIAASYIGDHSTDKLTSGTLANARLPARLQEYHTTATNDTTTSGWYYGNSGSPFTKYHTSNADFMIWTHGYSSVWASELATDFRTNRFAVRNLNNGTWNSWRELAGSNDIVNEFSWTSDINYDSVTNTFTNTRANNNWASQVYSKHGFSDGCYVSYKTIDATHAIAIGLNSDPTTDAAQASIDYAWVTQTNGKLYIRENNATNITPPTGHTTYAADDDFRIEYSHGTIRYYHNGVLCRSVDRAISGKLYLDSSFYNSGSITDLRFGPITNTSTISIAHGGTGATTFTKDCIIVSDGAATPSLVSRGLTVTGATNAAVTVSVNNTNSALTIKPNGSGAMTLSTAGGALSISSTGASVSLSAATTMSLSAAQGITISNTGTGSGYYLTLSSANTLFINKPTNASIIFTSGGASASYETARFNKNGNFQLESSSGTPKAGTQNTHKLYVLGDSAFEGKICFSTAASNAITNKAYMQWNATDQSIDFIFA